MTWNCLRQNGDMLYAVNVYICLMSHMPEQMVMRLQDGANICAMVSIYLKSDFLKSLHMHAGVALASKQQTNGGNCMC